MKELISSGLEALGLTGSVPPDAAEKLAEYGRLLLEKNQVMNLTAIRDEAGVARPPCSPAPTSLRPAPCWTWAPGRAFPACP